MIFRKGLVTLILIILIASIMPPAIAENPRIVILVSDNEADMTVAHNVGELVGASVYVSPWGTYSPEVSAEILSSEPDKVIIIGGPVAVPEEYTKDFEEFGVPFERWYGEDRYETNLAVVEALMTEFPEAFRSISAVLITNGRDTAAIRETIWAISTEFGGRALLLLTDSNREEITLNALGHFERVSRVKYIATRGGEGKPVFPLNEDKIGTFLVERFGNISSSELVSGLTREEAYSILIQVENKTARAEELLDGLQVIRARKMLESAKRHLEMAWGFYNGGEYTEAYTLAIRANSEADFVIAMAYGELRTVYQGSLAIQLQTKITHLKVMVSVLRRKGYDVSGVEELLRRADEALKEGNYQLVLNDLIPRIKEEIAALTTKRPLPEIPGGKRGRRP